MALHRAGQANAERILRELQWPHSRRAAERNPVLRLDHARQTIAEWADDFNRSRPHSALGYITPAALAANLTATDDRLRNPDQLRRSPVAQPAPYGVKPTG